MRLKPNHGDIANITGIARNINPPATQLRANRNERFRTIYREGGTLGTIFFDVEVEIILNRDCVGQPPQLVVDKQVSRALSGFKAN